MDKIRITLWRPENQTYFQIFSKNQTDRSQSSYFERLCTIDIRTNERVCDVYIHHLIEPLDTLIVKVATHHRLQTDDDGKKTFVPAPKFEMKSDDDPGAACKII